ncbi:unnamed protein product, partial [Iphiclides podalirius]
MRARSPQLGNCFKIGGRGNLNRPYSGRNNNRAPITKWNTSPPIRLEIGSDDANEINVSRSEVGSDDANEINASGFEIGSNDVTEIDESRFEIGSDDVNEIDASRFRSVLTTLTR